MGEESTYERLSEGMRREKGIDALRQKLKDLTLDQVVALFKGVLNNDYNLSTAIISQPGLLDPEEITVYPSAWEQAACALINTIANDFIFKENKGKEVLDSFIAHGIQPEELVSLLTREERSDYARAHIFSLITNIFLSKEIGPQHKKAIALGFIKYIEGFLNKNEPYPPKCHNLLRVAWEAVEEETPHDNIGWWREIIRTQGRNKADELKLAQLVSMAEIFQAALEYLEAVENKDASYEETAAYLFENPQLTDKFKKLNKQEMVQTKAGLMRFFSQKFEAQRRLEKEFPVIRYYQDKTEKLLALYMERKALERAGSPDRLEEIKRKIWDIRRELIGLRENPEIRKAYSRLTGYKLLANAREETMPEIMLVRMGLGTIVVEVDLKSLQRFLAAERLTREFDRRDVTMVLEDRPEPEEFDIEKLEPLLKKYSMYLIESFQSEMVAYLGHGIEALNIINFDDLINSYGYSYIEALKNGLKERYEVNADEEAQLDLLISQISEGDEWKYVKKQLKSARGLLIEIVDAKATDFYHEALKQGSPGTAVDTAKLKDESYRKALTATMSIFQFIPLTHLKPLEILLKQQKDKIAAIPEDERLVSKQDLRSMPEESITQDTISLRGFYERGGCIFTQIGAPSYVETHESRHHIYENFTSDFVKRVLPNMKRLYRQLNAVYKRSDRAARGSI